MLRIALLGTPLIERDGRPCPAPRGNKAWALLAYLLLSRRPPARRKLAELLFSEAKDPLGALRWSLTQLRQALGEAATLRGDPVELVLSAGSDIDLTKLLGSELPDAADLEALTGELLEGMTFSASPAFEAWLTVERRHLAASAEALLLERAQVELGAGHSDDAARLAARLLERNPLDEAHHELLVRSLVAAGRPETALARAEAGELLLQRELGMAPTSRLRDIVRAARRPPAPAPTATAGAARGQLDAGRAAIGAGAVDAGLQLLRSASATAAGCGDTLLHARAQLALGSALVHTMRAYGEAALALHRAVEAADHAGASSIAATAHRELGFVDVQAGRRERAESWLELAAGEAAGADAELASIASVRGMGLSDAASYDDALRCFEESVERARRCDSRRQVAWSLALMGRTHALLGRHAEARGVLEQSLALIADEKWIAVAPLPEVMLAHVDLREGRVDAAAEGLEHAFTIACQLADPCWEAIACRGIGLVEAARGRGEQALAWLTDGRSRCTRVAHPYQWIHAWVLDGMCAGAQRYEDERVVDWADDLRSLASRTGMRELLLRAYLYRARDGDVQARDAARLLGAEIDNPHVWDDFSV